MFFPCPSIEERAAIGAGVAHIEDFATLVFAESQQSQQRLRTNFNRAVAVAMADGPERGLALLQDLPLDEYHLFHAARADLLRLATAVEAARARSGRYPVDLDALASYWQAVHRDEAMPRDPFDGAEYGYRLQADGYRLWSSGPDGASETADDLVHEAAR